MSTRRKFTKSWIKLHLYELDDPVINLLTPPAFKLLHQLRLLTARLDNEENKIMPITHTLWALRMQDTSENRSLFDELIINGLINIPTSDGCIRLTRFEGQQAPMSAAERQRRKRAADKNAGIPSKEDVLGQVLDATDVPANYANMVAMLEPVHPVMAEMEKAIMQVVMDKISYDKIRKVAYFVIGLDDVTPDHIIQWYSGEECYWYTKSLGKNNDTPPYAKNIETTVIGARRHHLRAMKAKQEAEKKEAPVQSGDYRP